MKLGKRVKKWRKDNSLSMRKAGELLGVAHTTIQGIELGRTPAPDTGKRLAKAMGVSMDDLYSAQR